MKLQQPLDIALIGTGFRARTVYRPMFPALKRRGVRLVAVCDPIRESADAYAESMGVPAFYSVQDLVKARPMEAALVVAPVAIHYAVSCYLSAHGIHNETETSMAATLGQAREMVRAARQNNVVMRVGEQFFRLPFQRIAQKVAETGFIGPIRRVVSTHDHGGVHHYSCLTALFKSNPTTAQAIQHAMPVEPYHSIALRAHTDETFHANFFTFPDDGFAADMVSNGKGLLGRHPRPGYTQVEGTRGAIVWRAASRWNGPLHQGEGEVRYCSDHALQANGIPDAVFPIVRVQENEFSKLWQVHLPTAHVEVKNEFYDLVDNPADGLDYYHSAVAEHVVDFAQAVRGEAQSEYTDEIALMAMAMNTAAQQSILQDSARIRLPLPDDIGGVEAEQQAVQSFHEQYGVDHLDVEGMLNRPIPRG